MNEYKRLTEKTIGCFVYDLKDYKHKVNEFADYDAFFAYSMAVKRLGELEDKIEGGEIGDITELNEAYQELIENRDSDIENQERFAEQEGFTPDCTPYYIALQYKKRAEVAERKAKYIDNAFHSHMFKIAIDHEYAKKFIKFTLGTITRIYEEAVENAIKQAEKKLQEGNK